MAIRCCPRFTLLAEHEALCYLQSQLQDGEAVFAFLDDTFIVAAPGRVARFITMFSGHLAFALWTGHESVASGQDTNLERGR